VRIDLKNLTQNIKSIISVFVALIITLIIFVIFQKNIPFPSFNTTKNDTTVWSSNQVQQHVKTTEEKKLEEKIVHLLVPFVGSEEQIVANVSMDYDFAQHSTTSEQYGPAKMVRSEGTSLEREGNYSASENTKEYEISKTISTTKLEFPKIKRITAAVLVDSAQGDVENRVHIEELSLLVAQSIGLDKSRGDSVSVRSMKFQVDAHARKGWIFFYMLVALGLFVIMQTMFNRRSHNKADVSQPQPTQVCAQADGEALYENSPFDYLEEMTPSQITPLLESESPQIAALVLAHLDAARSAEVLSRFVEALRVEVVVRIAKMGNVSLEIVEKVSDALHEKLREVQKIATDIGGVSCVANVFSYMDEASAKAILEHIERFDSALASSIKENMTTFEDLGKQKDAVLRDLLRLAHKSDVLLALKGSSQQLKEKFYAVMPKDEREKFKEELRFLGAVKMREIEKAQSRIVELLQNSSVA
jgi:flagellar motor switch protein FliG